MARRRSAAVAGHQGDLAQARVHLDDGEPAVRASALRAVARAGGLDAHLLAVALEDPAPGVRMTALELAASRRDVPVDAAAARLDDPDQRVVEVAAWTCGEKISAAGADPVEALPVEGDPVEWVPVDAAPVEAAPVEAAPVVAALTRIARSHADPLCRESAVAALGAIGHPGGLPAILAGLDDRPEVRRRAVIALAPFDGPDVEAALDKASRDRDKQVRAAVAELRGPQDPPQPVRSDR